MPAWRISFPDRRRSAWAAMPRGANAPSTSPGHALRPLRSSIMRAGSDSGGAEMATRLHASAWRDQYRAHARASSPHGRPVTPNANKCILDTKLINIYTENLFQVA